MQTSILKITPQQIKMIHIAKSQLGIQDEDYREILKNYHVKSSKDLTFKSAKSLLQNFEKLGFKTLNSKNTNKSQTAKTKDYNDRQGLFSDMPAERYNKDGIKLITPAQCKMLYAVWTSSTKVREKTLTALNNFAKRCTGKDRIEWCFANETDIILSGIKKL